MVTDFIFYLRDVQLKNIPRNSWKRCHSGQELMAGISLTHPTPSVDPLFPFLGKCPASLAVFRHIIEVRIAVKKLSRDFCLNSIHRNEKSNPLMVLDER